jgi:hypothetical protein
MTSTPRRHTPRAQLLPRHVEGEEDQQRDAVQRQEGARRDGDETDHEYGPEARPLRPAGRAGDTAAGEVVN